MDNLDNTALIEERKKILMMILIKNNKPRCKDTINDEKIDHNDKTEYWPTSIKGSLNWLLVLISRRPIHTGYIIIKNLTVIVKAVLNV